MTDEEKKQMQDLKDVAGYYRAYSTSLRKELKGKDIEIGTLKGEIQELKDERALVKGDLKAFRKEVYIQGLHEQIKQLKKDNESLLCKIGVQHGNKTS